MDLVLGQAFTLKKGDLALPVSLADVVMSEELGGLVEECGA